MTVENPWLTGGSDPEPTDAERDPFRALGFGFSEESPAMQAPAMQAPVAEPAALPSHSVPAPSAPVSPLPVMSTVSSASTDLVPSSRRALREAERTEPVTRRSRREETSAPVAAPSGTGRRSARGAVAEPPATAATLSAAPRAASVTPTSSVPLTRRVAQKAFPPAVMLAVAALLVGTSVPANALFDPDAPPASLALSSMSDANTAEVVDLEGQVLEAEAVGDLATTAASRDAWTVTSYAEMLRLRYGSTNYAYTTTGTGPIRWPFPFVARITSAFGDRVAPCRGCSSYHRGVDFDAGYGAPVGAIADGIVTAVGRSSSFGYRVEVEHIINGQKVLSLYAHLIENSSVLTVGAPVVAGEIVGALGNTGLSTGPHLHLEIHIDSVPVDPFAWLVANAS